MPDDIAFEQMNLSEKDKLLSFLKTAYPDNPRQSDPEFWDWHFLDHPHSEADRLPIWLAKSDGRIVGQLATIPVRQCIGAEEVPAMWILDLIVDPEFRRRGIMKKLVLAATAYCPYLLGVTTNEQHSSALLQSLGWAKVKEIPRFHKLLFPGEAVREIARVKPVRSIVNLASAPLRSIRGTDTDGQIRPLQNFDVSFDDLGRKIGQQWGCSILRSLDMLDWQFVRQPNKKFDILGYFEDGRLLGYAILFFRKRNREGAIEKAAISDICYHPANAKGIVDALIAGSLKLAVERRAGGIVADCIDPLIEERLRHFGFWRVKSGLQFLANAPENQHVVYDPASWFLTRGDSDISIFEHPNL